VPTFFKIAKAKLFFVKAIQGKRPHVFTAKISLSEEKKKLFKKVCANKLQKRIKPLTL
jgi:hypothetical protein